MTTSAQLWKHVAKLRKAEGDHEGAARALRSAEFLSGYKHGHMTKTGPEIIWTAAARRKYAPQTIPMTLSLKDAA